MSNPHARNYGQWAAQALWLRRWGFDVNAEGRGTYRVVSRHPYMAVDALVDVRNARVLDLGDCEIGQVPIKEIAASARSALEVGAPGLRAYFSRRPWARADDFYQAVNDGRADVARRKKARLALRRHEERRVEELGRLGGTHPVGYVPPAAAPPRDVGLECPMHPITQRRLYKRSLLRRSLWTRFNGKGPGFLIDGAVRYWQLTGGRVEKWIAPAEPVMACPACRKWSRADDVRVHREPLTAQQMKSRLGLGLEPLLGPVCLKCADASAALAATIVTKTAINKLKKEIIECQKAQ